MNKKIVTITTIVSLFGLAFAYAEGNLRERMMRAPVEAYRVQSERAQQADAEMRAMYRANKEMYRSKKAELQNAYRDVRKAGAEMRQKYEERLRTATPEEREKILQEARLQKAQMRQQVNAHRAQINARVQQTAKSRFMHGVSMAHKRFDYVFARLDRIVGRIQAAIDKYRAQGADTSEAQTHLDTAKDKIAQAKDVYAKSRELVENVDFDDLESVRETVALLKEEYKKAITLLKEARAELKEAVKALKKAVQEMQADISVAPTTDTQTSIAP